ncbi:mechanosensitive ion channel family protein [Nakamurella leprariae]|uniref:Mechanosensitive ion channel family protein n=1 Tax=Nakamurella leprariae TaxID=2803911 RepID=A0A939BYL3_9ACTN|nr:mechanosensitive ion channel family protein [Nakamurella leprariae]MBM9467200.1 mechanosensitive ion channel family protein [Nakamurella leprariae]
MESDESMVWATDTWAGLALWTAIGVVAALAVSVVLHLVVRRVVRRKPGAGQSMRRVRLPLRMLLITIALQQVLNTSAVLGPWQGPARTVMMLVVLAMGGWLAVALVHIFEDVTLHRFRIDTVDNRKARRVRTQVSLLRRVAVAVIVILVIATMLLTLPGARQAGATIFASAGVIGIVAGLAAQSSLSNLFAGLQLAFTDAIRVDDVVVVEGEWGRIEDITLTYVVIAVWDDRRLILPSTYFTSTPFQNWTRTESKLLGTVELDVDWTVPLDALRAELDRVLAASEHWDGRVGVLQVTDATSSLVRLRALVSAVDGPTAFDLRCEVREALVGFLQRHHGHALPRVRVDHGAPDRSGARPAGPSHDGTDGLITVGSGQAEFQAARAGLGQPRLPFQSVRIDGTPGTSGLDGIGVTAGDGGSGRG